MSNIVPSPFYAKNVPVPERMLRAAAGLALTAVPWLIALPTWGTALLVANGAFVALTGFVGFCPACAMIGRKPVARRTAPR